MNLPAVGAASNTVFGPDHSYFGLASTSTQSFLLVAQTPLAIDPIAASYTQSMTLHGGNFDAQTFSFTAYSVNLPGGTLFSPETFDFFTSRATIGAGNVDLAFTETVVPSEATSVARLLHVSNITANLTMASLTLGTAATFYTFDTDLLTTGSSYRFSVIETFELDDVFYNTSTQLIFTAIPEPSTCAAIVGALGLAGVILRRRRTV